MIAATRKPRERELESLLRHCNFDAASEDGRPREQDCEWEFRLRLEAMGPLFAAFGRYLSSRADLVPGRLARTLSAIRDSAPPAPPHKVRELYSHELGCPAELAFRAFDWQPFQARLFWQAHRAVVGGADVVVKIVCPDIEHRLSDAAYLRLLEEPLAARGVSPAALATAIADFVPGLPDLTTWCADRKASAQLARDAQRFELLAAPHLYVNLSTPHVSVWRAWNSVGGAARPATESSRSLCLAWLRQALRGSTYPLEPDLENLGVDDDGRIVFSSGPFASLPDELKPAFWNYLMAVADDDADLAATHLIRALGNNSDDRSAEELRRTIRQMVPRPENWEPRGQAFSDQISDQILLHWRAAERMGLASQPFVSFQRGLYALGNAARSLSPERDWLQEAVRDLRLLTAFDEMQQAMRPSLMAVWMETHAETLVEMPARLEKLLAGGLARPSVPGSLGSNSELAANRRARAACALLAVAAAAMLLHKIAASAGTRGAAWLALLLLVVGLFALREVMR